MTGLLPRSASRRPAARLAAPTACPPQMPGLSRGPRIAIGHVGGALLRVAEHPLDRHVVHFGERAAQDRRHEEYGLDPRGLEKFGDEAATGHLCHRFLPDRVLVVRHSAIGTIVRACARVRTPMCKVAVAGPRASEETAGCRAGRSRCNVGRSYIKTSADDENRSFAMVQDCLRLAAEDDGG